MVWLTDQYRSRQGSKEEGVSSVRDALRQLCETDQNKAYMKGARADPSVNTIRTPSRSRKIMIGPSHHFLRIRIKAHSSPNIPIRFFMSFTRLMGVF